MSRLPPLDRFALTDRQRGIYDEIVGRRGGIGGPFEAWLRSPELADRAQRLGAFCRYRTSLEPLLSELAIVIVAARHRAEVEWHIHAPLALAAGIPPGALEQVRGGGQPEIPSERASAVAAAAHALAWTSRIPNADYDRAREALGETGLVELVGLVGYYTLVALTLNAFEAPLPLGAPKPFADDS